MPHPARNRLWTCSRIRLTAIASPFIAPRRRLRKPLLPSRSVYCTYFSSTAGAKSHGAEFPHGISYLAVRLQPYAVTLSRPARYPMRLARGGTSFGGVARPPLRPSWFFVPAALCAVLVKGCTRREAPD